MSTATILPEQISAAWDNTPQSPVEGGVEHNTPDSAPMLHAPSGTQSGAAIVFGSRTLTIGGQRITSHGQIVSAASDGLIVEIPGTTVKASSNIIAELPLGTITAYASKVPLPYGHVGFVLGSQTLTVGGDPITVSAQVIQAGADGLSYQEMTTAQFVDSIASIVASGSTLLATGTVLSGGRNAAVIGSHTLTENGQAMTINGEVMSMGTGGVQVLAAASSLPLADMLLTLGSETVAVRQTVDFDGQTKMIINDHTLISGGPTAIIDGQVISLGAEGVVLEGRISTFPYQHDRQSSDSASKYELRTTAFHDEKDHASKTQIVTAVRPQSAQTTHSGSDLSQCPDSTVVAALLVAVVLVSNSFA